MSLYQPTKISYLAGFSDYAPIYEGQNINAYLMDILEYSDKTNVGIYEYIKSLLKKYKDDLSTLETVGNVISLNWGANAELLQQEVARFLADKEAYSVNQSFSELPMSQWWKRNIIAYNYPINGDVSETNEFMQFLFENGGLFLYTCFTDEDLSANKAIEKKNLQLDLLLKIKPSYIPLDLCKAMINLSAVEHTGYTVDDVLMYLKTDKLPNAGVSSVGENSSSNLNDQIKDWTKLGIDMSAEIRKWFDKDGGQQTSTTNYYNVGADKSDFSNYMPYIIGGVALLLVVSLFSNKKKNSK